MYKKAIVLGGFFIFILLPSIAQAREKVELPAGAIGITEVEYRELKNAVCEVTVPHSDTPMDCGNLVAELFQNQHQFFGSGELVVFRLEHAGEMYRINKNDEGPLKIDRYLPNGFYIVNTKNTVMWVADGKKQRLSSSKAYTRIIQSAQNNDGRIVPISEYDYATLQWGCDFCDGHQRIIEQNELYNTLDGSIIMRVEAEGQLYYIENEDLQDYTESISSRIKSIDDIRNNKKLFTFARQHAASVAPSLMRQIPTL